MARVLFRGWESNDASLEGGLSGAGATIQGATKRSGGYALSIAAASGTPTYAESQTSRSAKEYYRFYFRPSVLPAGTNDRGIWGGNPSTGVWQLKWERTTNKLYFNYGGLNVGTSTTAVSDTSKWYRIEIWIPAASSGQGAILKIDGTTEITTSAVGSSSWPSSCLGAADAGVGTYTAFFDDYVIDDKDWVGDSKLSLALPISDNARAVWVAGAGGTTDLFEAVNNTPPVGTASETNTTQIEHPSGDGNEDYVANLTTYQNLGLSEFATRLDNYVTSGLARSFDGSGTTAVYWSTSFLAPASGALRAFRVVLGRSGIDPTDNILWELWSDDGTGKPSSKISDLVTMRAEIITGSALDKILIVASPPSLTSSTRYHIVGHRSGAQDTGDYINWYVRSTNLGSETACSSSNGTSWTSGFTTFGLDVIVGNGTLVIASQGAIVHGEDVNTGTKTLTWRQSLGDGSFETNFSAGNDGGALGTYPTGWVIHRQASVPIREGPYLTSYTTSPTLTVRRPGTESRTASVCFMGTYIEWVLFETTGPSASGTTAINGQGRTSSSGQKDGQALAKAGGSGGITVSGFKSGGVAAIINGQGGLTSAGTKQGFGRTLENQFAWSEDISKYVLHMGAEAMGSDGFGGYSYGLAFPNAIVDTPVGQQTGFFVAEETDTTGHHGYGKRSWRVGWLAAGDRVNYREWIDYSNAGKDWFRFECYDGSKATSQYKRAWFNWSTKSWGTVDAGLTAVAKLDANGYYKFELSWVAAGDGGTDFQYVDVAGASADGSTSTYLGSSGNSWNTWGRQLWFGFSSMPYVTTQRLARYGSMQGGGGIVVRQIFEFSGTAAIRGEGRIITSGFKAATGSASISGNGGVRASGDKQAFNTAKISGSGRVITFGTSARNATAAISGSGRVIVTGRSERYSTAAIRTGGSVISFGNPGMQGAAVIRSGGSVISSGSAAKSGAAIIRGSGSIITFGTSDRSSTAIISGSGRITAFALIEKTGTAKISGGGSIASYGQKAGTHAARITGSGGVEVDQGAKVGEGIAIISGSGGLTSAQGSKAAFSFAFVKGEGRISSSGLLAPTSINIISGSGRVISEQGRKDATGTASIKGGGSITSSGEAAKQGTASLTGSGRIITVEATLGTIEGFAVFSGSGGITVMGVKNALSYAMINGQGQLKSEGFKSLVGAPPLVGQLWPRGS